jgi:hypothetical protein
MAAFGTRSEGFLSEIHLGLVEIARMVIPFTDYAILCGRRGEAAQTEAFLTGRSGVPWPRSKHNAVAPGLSDAFDFAPWFPDPPHIRWDHEREFVQLAGRLQQAADQLGIEVRWGGDWDRDDDLYDFNKPFDLGHLEIWGPPMRSTA